MTELRIIFDEDAELYDRARPPYPEPLFDELVRLAGLRPGDRALEIGSGTGKASVPLARRGLRLTGVEPGENLARVARRNLGAFPTAEVQVGAFESWPLPAEPFDLVVAATCWHWLDPDVRFVRPWAGTFTAREYLDLLSSFSGHRAMAPADRGCLFAGISAVIAENGGRIQKHHAFTLTVASRR